MPEQKQAIVQRRLQNHYMTEAKLATPADVVEWLGAVQAQDYEGAKWAVAQRTPAPSAAAIEQAIVDGALLRTHILRPTWHFVAPADIRWMLALTAPRINALNAYWYRQLELDDAIFARSSAVLERALSGGLAATRDELAAALSQDGIDTQNILRLGHMLMHAELAGLICNGARRGKQQTYVLLDERAPQAAPRPREEALAELARRYFISHGPATLQDYTWWSGLSAADARAGLELVRSQLLHETVGEQAYWYAENGPQRPARTPIATLLPNYDEYVVGYTDRSAIYDPQHNRRLDARGNILFQHSVAIDGRIIGTWKRSFKKSTAFLDLTLFTSLSEAEHNAIEQVVQQYSAFLDMPVIWRHQL